MNTSTAVWRWFPVWQRNFYVWYKLIGPAVIGNIGEPLFYLVLLGYGLGSFVGPIEGVPYMAYLASGMVCASAMNTASFEGMYSAYTRMIVQGTWTGMLMAPLSLRDVVIGEMAWTGTKGLISATAIVFIATILGLVVDWKALWLLPLALLIGICFGAMGLAVAALARNYDFFLYYTTLIITPMTLLSGVFFPIAGMPVAVQYLAKAFPLYHAIALMRPLMLGSWPIEVLPHLVVIFVYLLVAVPLAQRLAQRRLLS